MGQRFSDLRGYMLTMDQPDSDASSSDSKMDGDNGNMNGDQRFEDIYAAKSDRSDGGSDELNGNEVHSPDCEAVCTCAPSRTRTCRGKEEPGSSRRTSRSSSSGTVKKCRQKRKDTSSGGKKKGNWGLRLTSCARAKSDADLPDVSLDGCVCTGYRRVDTNAASSSSHQDRHRCSSSPVGPAIDLNRFNPEDFPIEDCDERARLERAREMAEGVDPPPGFVPALVNAAAEGQLNQLDNLDSIAAFFQARLGLHPGVALTSLSALSHNMDIFAAGMQYQTHSQADYIHCLVPDLLEITRCSFYWGKMDRYEAERLLEGRPEGTFLLRDSAQEEHLFSVSFRKYDRSLHARIEQWNHKFSFDSHDPGVFSSSTVVGLLEHYKDPSFCMFFEPMLTIPLHRTFPFPLQHLCRAVISKTTKYDAINRLPLPRSLKVYLREYHYKQRLRIRYLDSDL